MDKSFWTGTTVAALEIQSEFQVSEKQSSNTDTFRFGQDVYRLDLTNLTWKLLVDFAHFPIVLLFPVLCYLGFPGVHRRAPSAQGFPFSNSNRFEIFILYHGLIVYGFICIVPWPLSPRLFDVHLWGTERPDRWSVASQHGAWLLQQQGQIQIYNCLKCWKKDV